MLYEVGIFICFICGRDKMNNECRIFKKKIER